MEMKERILFEMQKNCKIEPLERYDEVSLGEVIDLDNYDNLDVYCNIDGETALVSKFISIKDGNGDHDIWKEIMLNKKRFRTWKGLEESFYKETSR